MRCEFAGNGGPCRTRRQIEVETHIEPLEVHELSGRDAGASRPAKSPRPGGAAAESGTILEIHSVRARQTPAGLVVNYHCRVDAALTVAAVHEAVDEVDRSLRSTSSTA